MLVSCLKSCLARESDAKNQVSQYAKGTQLLHCIGRLHPVWPYSFFNHKKQTSPVFALLFKHPSASKHAKVSPCRKTGPYSPCSHFTTNSTGELPNRSNHIHWERFHTTLDILRHGQTQAQPQLQHTHTLHSRPAAHTHTDDETHSLFSDSAGQTFWTAICPKADLRGIYFTICF